MFLEAASNCLTTAPDEIASKPGALLHEGREVVLSEGQSLFWAGEENPPIAIVQSGYLKLWSGLEDGRTQILRLVFPDELIGHELQSHTAYSATALTPTKLIAVPRSAWDEMLRSNSQIEQLMLAQMVEELERAQHHILLLGQMTAQEKLATFLSEFIERSEAPDLRRHETGAVVITLPFGRDVIAEILGLSLETVSRQFTCLSQAGLIEVRHRKTVRVPNPKLLARSGYVSALTCH